MEGSMKGDVVVVTFPYSNFSDAKKRPAIVLMELSGEDSVLAAISASNSGPYTISLNETDFASGKLNKPSFIRITHLFTIDKQRIERCVGRVTEKKRKEVVDLLYTIMS